MDPFDNLNRRDAARLLGAAVLATVPAAHLASSADAARGWCRVDPVVKIAGRVADVVLSAPRGLNDAATGPTEIVISVPVGTSHDVLATDRGFGGHGYDVRFVEDTALGGDGGSLEVTVEVRVPSRDDSIPVRVDFLPRSSDLGKASAEGRTNTWISLTTR